MGNSTAFLIISAAVAGYIFATKCYRFKYKVARESGYQLYLTSLTFGYVFMFVSWSMTRVPYLVPSTFGVTPLFVVSDSSDAIWISATAIALSLIAALIYNQKVPFARERNAYKVWKKNDFDHICYKAMAGLKPIAISNDSGKVYVGYVIDTLSPEEENAHLTILPIYSGYRAPATLKFIIASKYQYIVDLINSEKEEDHIELENYYMAFPREKINSLHIFNDHIHKTISRHYPIKDSVTADSKE